MATRNSGEINDSQGTDNYEGDEQEQHAFLNHNDSQRVDRSRVSTYTKLMAVINLLLGILLATSLAVVARSSTRGCPQYSAQVVEPYSPALEAVVPVIRKFKPELIFQSETSPEVEAAWKRTLGESDGLVAVGPEESGKLAKTNHESAESVWEPGKHVYGISMYHQLHCLNTIRKSFYRDKFYPNLPDVKYNFHKNHCFDFLRQAIMCHGDVSMTYWWNKNYTSRRSDGTEIHSEWFESLTTDERATNSSVFWDIEHSCRMFEPIEDWVNQHPILPSGISFPDEEHWPGM